jgi:hypothetical protein
MCHVVDLSALCEENPFMTIKSQTFSHTLHPQIYWQFGGWGSPTHHYQLNAVGEDGKGKINPYELTVYERYEGYDYSSYGLNLSTYRFECGSVKRGHFYCFRFPNGPSGQTLVTKLGLNRNQAINAAFQKAADHSFNASVTLAEGKETLHYLNEVLQRIFKSYRFAKRGDFTRAGKQIKAGIRAIIKNGSAPKFLKKTVKGLPRNWLEYRYAVMPLIYDAEAAFEYYKSLDTKTLIAVRGRSRSDILSTVSSGPYMGNLQYWPDLRATTSTEVGFYLRPDVDYRHINWSNYGLVAWELLTLSFLVDWILPIGDYLEATHYLPFAKWENGYVSDVVSYHTGNPVGFIGHQIWFDCQVPISFSKSFEKRFHFKRTRLTALSGKFPTLQNPISRTSHWKRIVDTVALFEGRRRPGLRL